MNDVILRIEDHAPRQILILPALFEEANRMRRFTNQLMRGLAQHNIGTTLPDLPGQGEDQRNLADIDFSNWQNAVARIAKQMPQPLFTIAIRGGALLDGIADYRWRLAPETGARITRDMIRATALTSGQSAKAIDARAQEAPTRLAGSLISPSLYTSLQSATPIGEARTPELSGKKLWRSAEPDEDQELLAASIADIRDWIAACEQ